MSPDSCISCDRPQAGKESVASLWLAMAAMGSAALRDTDVVTSATEGQNQSVKNASPGRV